MEGPLNRYCSQCTRSTKHVVVKQDADYEHSNCSVCGTSKRRFLRPFVPLVALVSDKRTI